MRDERYTMFGRIVVVNGETHQMLTGLHVKAVVQNKGSQSVLGETETDSTGNFSIEISQPDVITSGSTDILFEVYDDHEKIHAGSIAAPGKVGNDDIVKLAIRGDVTPAAAADSNAVKGRQLLDSLFNEKTGAQKEYKPDPNNSDPNVLTDFDRVWVYSQGIALHQAARRFDTNQLDEYRVLAHKLFGWLYREKVTFPSPNGREIFGGWHFSQNTKTINEDSDVLEDNFKDPRLVTGANAWALNGVARYVTSSAFSDLTPGEQFEFRRFYGQVLDGLLDHQRKADGLFTAGWDLYILQNVGEDEAYIKEHIQKDIPRIIKVLRTGSMTDKSKVQEILKGGKAALGELMNLLQQQNGEHLVRDYLNPSSGNIRGRRYNFILAVAGYPDDPPNDPDDPNDPGKPYYLRVPKELRKPVKARNIVTEHNNDMLAVLNLAIDHSCELGLSDSKRRELIRRRGDLRKGIFGQLYDGVKNRIVTGRSPDGCTSFYSAIDNAAWIATSANLKDPDGGGLSELYRDRLANALLYTIKQFTKEITVKRNGTTKTYFGAHYFEPGFEDPYISGPGADQQDKVFHVEGTTSLIMGLKKFWRAYQNHPYSKYFGYIADGLWENVVEFVTDHNFIYGSIKIQDLFEPLESSTTATWYIDTYDYLSDLPVSSRVPVIPEPEPPPAERISILYNDWLRYGLKAWGSAADNGRGVSVEYDDAAADGIEPGSKALKVTYSGEGDSDWGGLTFCYWARWRKEGDIGADLSGVDKLTFFAKASRGGMKFNTGVGVDREARNSKDSATTGDKEITLTTEWAPYEVDISELANRLDINGLMKIGFLKESRGPGWGAGTIWLDHIKFESNSPTDAPVA